MKRVDIVKRRSARDAGYYDAEKYLASLSDYADGIAAKLLDRDVDARQELLSLAQALREKAVAIGAIMAADTTLEQ